MGVQEEVTHSNSHSPQTLTHIHISGDIGIEFNNGEVACSTLQLNFGESHIIWTTYHVFFCWTTILFHYSTTSRVHCDNNSKKVADYSLNIFKRLEIASMIRD